MKKPFKIGGIYGVYGEQLELFERVWTYCLQIFEDLGKPTKEHKGLLITTEDGLYCWNRKRNTKIEHMKLGKLTAQALPTVVFDRIIWLGGDFEAAKIELVKEFPEGEERSSETSNINSYIKKKKLENKKAT